ncbi:MAG: hypothetical protein LBM71_05605 [Elusimicrobiota bacterium]|jgi:hypothetical protein|nr:hypothetical protein [Elusimicrobiota bacterium]
MEEKIKNIANKFIDKWGFIKQKLLSRWITIKIFAIAILILAVFILIFCTLRCFFPCYEGELLAGI